MLSLDDLVALNDEILALVRAGVPLELGLRHSSATAGRMSRFTEGVAQRLSAGTDLASAVEAGAEGVPPIYRAMVEAGLRSGQLGRALEGVATAARQVGELRRLLLVAMAYPLVVFLLSYGLFVFMLGYVFPSLELFAERNPTALLLWMSGLRESLPIWGPIIPVVVIAAWCIWTYQTSRALSLAGGGVGSRLRLPLVSTLVREARFATFAELLALLVEHQVPLDQAVRLAADAAADDALVQAGRRLASSVAEGRHLGNQVAVKGFPSLVAWALSQHAGGENLAESLHSAAASYHQRVLRRADLLRIYLPAALTLIIGGCATLLYTLSLFWPFTQMLHRLASPTQGI